MMRSVTRPGGWVKILGGLGICDIRRGAPQVGDVRGVHSAGAERRSVSGLGNTHNGRDSGDRGDGGLGNCPVNRRDSKQATHEILRFLSHLCTGNFEDEM